MSNRRRPPLFWGFDTSIGRSLSTETLERFHENDVFSASEAATYVSAMADQRLSVRTLLALVRKGKIAVADAIGSADEQGRQLVVIARRKMRRKGVRGLWFPKDSLVKLVEAHRILIRPGRIYETRISRTLSSRKVADSRFSPGEVITKADAALILDLSVHGVEDLMQKGQLKTIRLGHRLAVLRLKKVLALQRVRGRKRSGKRNAGVRTCKTADLRTLVRSIRTNSIAART